MPRCLWFKGKQNCEAISRAHYQSSEKKVSSFVGQRQSGKKQRWKRQQRKPFCFTAKLQVGNCPLQLPMHIHTHFQNGRLHSSQIRALVEKAQAGSGTTDKTYKNCPKLLKTLYNLLQTLWKKRHKPILQTLAEDCFVTQEQT